MPKEGRGVCKRKNRHRYLLLYLPTLSSKLCLIPAVYNVTNTMVLVEMFQVHYSRNLISTYNVVRYTFSTNNFKITY